VEQSPDTRNCTRSEDDDRARAKRRRADEPPSVSIDDRRLADVRGFRDFARDVRAARWRA